MTTDRAKALDMAGFQPADDVAGLITDLEAISRWSEPNWDARSAKRAASRVAKRAAAMLAQITEDRDTWKRMFDRMMTAEKAYYAVLAERDQTIAGLREEIDRLRVSLDCYLKLENGDGRP